MKQKNTTYLYAIGCLIVGLALMIFKGSFFENASFAESMLFLSGASYLGFKFWMSRIIFKYNNPNETYTPNKRQRRLDDWSTFTARTILIPLSLVFSYASIFLIGLQFLSTPIFSVVGEEFISFYKFTVGFKHLLTTIIVCIAGLTLIELISVKYYKASKKLMKWIMPIVKTTIVLAFFVHADASLKDQAWNYILKNEIDIEYGEGFDAYVAQKEEEEAEEQARKEEEQAKAEQELAEEFDQVLDEYADLACRKIFNSEEFLHFIFQEQNPIKEFRILDQKAERAKKTANDIVYKTFVKNSNESSNKHPNTGPDKNPHDGPNNNPKDPTKPGGGGTSPNDTYDKTSKPEQERVSSFDKEKTKLKENAKLKRKDKNFIEYLKKNLESTQTSIDPKLKSNKEFILLKDMIKAEIANAIGIGMDDIYVPKVLKNQIKIALTNKAAEKIIQGFNVLCSKAHPTVEDFNVVMDKLDALKFNQGLRSIKTFNQGIKKKWKKFAGQITKKFKADALKHGENSNKSYSKSFGKRLSKYENDLPKIKELLKNKKTFFKTYIQSGLGDAKMNEYCLICLNNKITSNGFDMNLFDKCIEFKKDLIAHYEQQVTKILGNIKLYKNAINKPAILNNYDYLDKVFSPGGIFFGNKMTTIPKDIEAYFPIKKDDFEVNKNAIQEIQVFYREDFKEYDLKIKVNNQYLTLNQSSYSQTFDPELFLLAYLFNYGDFKSPVLVDGYYDGNDAQQFVFNDNIAWNARARKLLAVCDEFIFEVLKENESSFSSRYKTFDQAISKYKESQLDRSRIKDVNYMLSTNKDEFELHSNLKFSVVSKNGKDYVEEYEISDPFNKHKTEIFLEVSYMKQLQKIAAYQGLLRSVKEKNIDVFDLIVSEYGNFSKN